jgi:nicotinate-nucleotide pyrophosphorylase (carboxylating)
LEWGRVKEPDWAAHFGEEFRSVDFRAERAGVDEYDRAGDRLEGGAEMLLRLDRDGAVAGRVDAERGELAEIDGLARAIAEASGRINLETAPIIAATGVDLISNGWITHSAPILDLGLDVT